MLIAFLLIRLASFSASTLFLMLAAIGTTGGLVGVFGIILLVLALATLITHRRHL